MWAAQRCHYYIVSLFLQSGADPLITDAQGYNILHLATHDGNVFLLIYLLQQNIPIDTPDPQGHTSLMWAAYKGYPAVVDLFLRWGANIKSVDEEGLTALHWALVKGNPACIQKLIEYGCDRFAETNSGKTPTVTAEEMGSTLAWQRALRECGFQKNGTPNKLPYPFASMLGKRSFHERFFFLSPFLLLVICFIAFSRIMVFAALILSAFFAYTFQYLAPWLLQWAPSDMKHIHRTVRGSMGQGLQISILIAMQPYLAGIFAASLFWVGVRWLWTILPCMTPRDVGYATVPNYKQLHTYQIFYPICSSFYLMAYAHIFTFTV